MQIKITLRYHLTPVRMTKIKNTNDSLRWWKCKLAQPLWKSVWWFLRKLAINLPQNPAIPLLGIFPKDVQSYSKDVCLTMFTAALFVIARTWKQPQPMNDILKFACKGMELENTMLSEVTQTQTDEYGMYSLCMYVNKWILAINKGY